MRPRSAFLSICLHLAAVFVAAYIGSQVRQSLLLEPQKHYVPLTFTPLSERPDPSGGGSGHDVLPPSHGSPPPPARHKIFVPPTVTIVNQNPKLPVEMGLLDTDPHLVVIDAIGDPMSKYRIPSSGPGGRDGIGIGDCCGIGPGHGPRLGGPTGVISGTSHHGSRTQPRLVYMVDPEYSDEARKTHFEGTVVLVIEVDSTGKVKNPRIVRPLGLGLDEKALEAVARWRFQPALADGRPVPSPATVEVRFRLL